MCKDVMLGVFSFCLKQKTDEAVHEYPCSLGAVIRVRPPPPLPSQWLYKNSKPCTCFSRWRI